MDVHPPAAIADAVTASLAPQIAALQSFVDRRIAELSAELHASVELADMTEAKIGAQLSDIHGRIAQLVAVPSTASRNSGLELEAVVAATEAAADTILESAEAIQDAIGRGARDPEAAAEISRRVNAIFEACGFQDVTGQRIRRAIQHLQQVDDALQSLIPAGDKPTAAARRVEVATAYATAPALSPELQQAAIDALLNG